MRLPLLLKAVILAGLTIVGADASAEACNIEKKAELALGYANSLATAEARINGAAVTMGLDTGAQSLVTPQTAEELRLPASLNHTLEMGTTAPAIVGHVILRDFEFAGTHYDSKDVLKIKLPEPKMPDLKAKPVAGLVGMEVLANYDFDIDFPHRKLTLYSVKNCASVPPPDFTNMQAIPFMSGEQRKILFPIELNGKKLTALLDTGSVLNAITRAGVEKAGVTEVMLKADLLTETTGVGNISVKQPLHKFSKLTVGGVEQLDVPFSLLAMPLSQADVLIGQSYLLSRRIRVSNATRTLYVENEPVPAPYN